jgi:hypothetical protein
MASPKKPWRVDTGGNVDTGRGADVWRRIKWGQLLAFGSGAFACVLAVGNTGYCSRDRAEVGALLMATGIALRALDIWKTRKT